MSNSIYFTNRAWAMLVASVCMLPWFDVTHSASTFAGQVSLQPVECHSDYFGGQTVNWIFDLTSDVDQEIDVHWTLQVKSQTLARRSFTVNAQANKTSRVHVEFESPAGKEGVIVHGNIALRVVGQMDASHADFTKQIFFFSKDPFFASSRWLEELDITLVDPVGHTTLLLESLAIPFRKANSQPKNAERGLLIIGELTPWNSATETMVRQAVAAGRPVLCLATLKGRIEFNTLDFEQLPEVALHNLSFVNQLDKRLTASRCESLGRCNMVHQNGRIIIQVSPNEAGWPFLECKDTSSLGHLILCCTTMRPNESPTETYLFAKLLERLSPKQPSLAELRK